MTKQKMIEAIMEKVSNVTCIIGRVYGVSSGVGYDLTARIDFDQTDNENPAALVLLVVEAHALRQTWAAPGHLRPNNPRYKYSGSCDHYQNRVLSYWESPGNPGFEEYLTRLKKDDITALYDEVLPS